MSEQLFDKYIRFDVMPDTGDLRKFRSNTARIEKFLTAWPGVWFTKEEIRKACGLPEGTEIRARCNDLRERWAIDCEKIDGRWRYRLSPKPSQIIGKEEATTSE